MVREEGGADVLSDAMGAAAFALAAALPLARSRRSPRRERPRTCEREEHTGAGAQEHTPQRLCDFDGLDCGSVDLSCLSHRFGI